MIEADHFYGAVTKVYIGNDVSSSGAELSLADSNRLSIVRSRVCFTLESAGTQVNLQHSAVYALEGSVKGLFS